MGSTAGSGALTRTVHLVTLFVLCDYINGVFNKLAIKNATHGRGGREDLRAVRLSSICAMDGAWIWRADHYPYTH